MRYPTYQPFSGDSRLGSAAQFLGVEDINERMAQSVLDHVDARSDFPIFQHGNGLVVRGVRGHRVRARTEEGMERGRDGVRSYMLLPDSRASKWPGTHRWGFGWRDSSWGALELHAGESNQKERAIVTRDPRYLASPRGHTKFAIPQPMSGLCLQGGRVGYQGTDPTG